MTATLRFQIKHAGSALTSPLILMKNEADAKQEAEEYWMEFFDPDLGWKESDWFVNKNGMLEKKYSSIPPKDETHFVIRFTIEVEKTDGS